MKTVTTQPIQPIDPPQITSPIDTPTEILVYLTLVFTLGTSTLKSANTCFTEFKKLKKQWNPSSPKKSPHPKKRK